MNDIVRIIRDVLRKPFPDNLNKFRLLKDLAELVSNNSNAAQELVLRLFERKFEFQQYHEIVVELMKQVGLYPYLKDEILSIRDAIALEMHRPEGLDSVVFHQSQSEVYNHLMDGENVILSAPTSYGKSLIIDAIIASGRYKNIVVIVPSIALIDETRKRLAAFKEQYKIITYPYQAIAERNVLILTQERAVEIIDKVPVDFFVIDEFYKISTNSNGDERYQILNQVFYKLVKSKAQFYLLGPNIDNIETGALDNIQYIFIKTDFKTVVSERHRVRVKNNEERFDKLVEILKSTTDPTLVFCKSPKSANDLAKQLLEADIYGEVDNNKDVTGWIKENYHPDWILPNAVEHGIGVHHGRNPRALSQQFVKMFNEEKLKCLICTSTLIEGVNTKAKTVVIYDNKIARNDIDFFTFNNICGRSGRMFSHFVGHVFLFSDPPEAELPLVDFPIFTQTNEVPDELLINVKEEDLSEESKERIKEYVEQDIIPVQVLRDNSYIGLDKQLRLAKELDMHASRVHPVMSWRRTPTADQLNFVCKVIWNYFEGGRRMVYGVASGDQLAFRINSYRKAGSIKQFIKTNIKDNCDINAAIELSLDIQRHWINFKFPRYLRSLCQITNEVFKKHNLALCDYSYYASLVESYFYPNYVAPFDEYGLPVQVTTQLMKSVRFSNDLDEALQQLKTIEVEKLDLSDIEKYFVRNVQQYL